MAAWGVKQGAQSTQGPHVPGIRPVPTRTATVCHLRTWAREKGTKKSESSFSKKALNQKGVSPRGQKLTSLITIYKCALKNVIYGNSADEDK